ncbi:MAG: hypothetical protein M3083_00110, partial [Actinomycetota bacterium]|nr:hypothetical protein [Actinomycetota bacterium]
MSVTAASALSGIGTIAGVLTRLHAAVVAAKGSAATGRAGAAATQGGLGTIAALVDALNIQSAAMVTSSSHLSVQEA